MRRSGSPSKSARRARVSEETTAAAGPGSAFKPLTIHRREAFDSRDTNASRINAGTSSSVSVSSNVHKTEVCTAKTSVSSSSPATTSTSVATSSPTKRKAQGPAPPRTLEELRDEISDLEILVENRLRDHNEARRRQHLPEQDPQAVVQTYIQLLNDYNRVKDTTQTLFDKIAEYEQITARAVHARYGLSDSD
ncbi:hypothetical protein BCV70DRAFT_203313 [Testicularia cyperi]|uniref:Swi5-domain-containing protein n=1 Tax=Testicularia cyperi TaxID=1882483 RepID=A0A317XGA5_9BASI|nr:hypothetical protein BCV70DRAFT_203313 [Testicularia cyperi]